MTEYLSLILAPLVSFVLTWLAGYVFIPALHKLKFGQTILDIGPSWHKKKQGTPTMGGILFILGCTVSLLIIIATALFTKKDLIAQNAVVASAAKTKFYAGLFMMLCFAAIGAMDDYIKVKHKSNAGLTIVQKTAMQLIVSAGYLASLYSAGASTIFMPFIGNVNFGWLFWPFGFITLFCTINAVNFTDGIDGLCSSVTVTYSLAIIAIGIIRGVFGASLLASAVMGGLLGFLIWNRYPAKVFMGDTGSLFLGGFVAATAFMTDTPWIILLAGIVYVIEFLSDIIQISYFKATHGKRLFKMAPIHHHFEKCGWSEKKINVVFCAANLIGCVITVLLIYFGRAR